MFPLSAVTVIQDNLDNKGDHFLLSVLKGFCERSPASRVLYFSTSCVCRQLFHNYPLLAQNKKIDKIDAWTTTAFISASDTPNQHEIVNFILEERLKVNVEVEKSTEDSILVVFDCLNDFILGDIRKEEEKINQLATFIHTFKNHNVSVCGLIHSDLFCESDVLKRLAVSVPLWYSLDSNEQLTLCSTRHRKSNGKLTLKTEAYLLDPNDLNISDIRPFKSPEKKPVLPQTVPATPKPGSVMNTPKPLSLPGPDMEKSVLMVPFDIGLKLSAKERKAKEALTLPYTQVKPPEDGSGYWGSKNINQDGCFVGLRKREEKGGKVFYVAEAEDDLDDSDPDEDLNI